LSVSQSRDASHRMLPLGSLSLVTRQAAGLMVRGGPSLSVAFAAVQGVRDGVVAKVAGVLGAGLLMMAASAEEAKASESGAGSSPGGHATRPLLENLTVGAVAGASVETALYPLDTIKTRIQSGSYKMLDPRLLKGVYSGLPGNIAGCAPATGIFFAVYDPVKCTLLDRLPESQSVFAHLGAAMSAAMASSVLRVPTEVVKQRTQMGMYNGATQAVKGILAKEGVKGLYSGYSAFMLRELPFDAIEFVAYEQLKLNYSRLVKGGEAPNSLETAVLGAVAGATTAVATTPLDVIKTRFMLAGAETKYTSVANAFSTIFKEEGMKGLFAGVGPRVMWISIGGMIFFTTMEEVRKQFQKQ